jgi:catechol 2,3-dioxygenase-like lactoylglutathione lyase family enzyme
MSETTGTRITGVTAIAIPVTDQDRALEFYVGTLGFEKRMDVPFGPGRWITVAPPGASTVVALVLPGEGASAGVDTGIRFTSGDATADHAALLARGVDADPQVMRIPGVPPMFTFRDQDGNRLVIVEQAPV